MANSRQPRPFSLPEQARGPQASATEAYESTNFAYAGGGLIARVAGLMNVKLLLSVLIVLQVVIIGFLAYPFFFSAEAVARQIVSEVRERADVSPVALPDEIVPIENADAIRGNNEVLAEIFKDAQDGDYVLNYGNERWLVYRRDSGEIIYDGPSVSLIIQQNEQTLVADILEKSKERGLYKDGDEVPSFSAISDPDESRGVDPQFYAEAEEGDIIVVYANNKVALYRPATKALYKVGNINSSITIE